MRGIAENKDTVLFDSYVNGKPYYIPAEESTLKGLFSLLKKGDSLSFSVSADSLYLKSFGAPPPANIGTGETIHFLASLVDVYSQAEMQKKIEDQSKDNITRDSLNFQSYLGSLDNVQKTASGLCYQIIKKGNGKKVQKGASVSVQYKGTLLDGTVFDQNMDGKPNFTFNVGQNQVIPGWDEGLQLMSEGDEFKFIIPYKLAYGPQGNGPIPAYSSLVFEVKLIKVN
jgi:FKBP-type peptidyl-prolyl cis-trans isomerase